MIPSEVCESCASTPSGIEGHSALAPYDDANKQRLFRCAACSTVWRRSYLGSGEFFWIPVGFEEGLGKRSAD